MNPVLCVLLCAIYVIVNYGSICILHIDISNFLFGLLDAGDIREGGVYVEKLLVL